MQRRTSLFVLTPETPSTAISTAAESARAGQAHLACLLLDTLPGMPSFVYGGAAVGGVVLPDNWPDLLQEARGAAAERAAEIEALLTQAGCAGDVQYAVASGADIRLFAAQRAASCDVAQAAPGLRADADLFREASHGILFNSPVPLMVNGDPLTPYERIFLAWNSSLAAARAAHAALPYFLQAHEVVIGCFDPEMSTDRDGEDPGTDIAGWLSHHGCNVTLSQFPSGGHEIGRCITERAAECGAEMVVMGAYGHSRLRQAMFGGTTRTMMEQHEIPVLFAH
ncbi:universal stress protein [Cribrihabitans neustonicus]|uniref:universal stress protein n=1 Tax=Cribrihabitans neustonicus TaxID=1429085 RepID=UPI003B5CB678